LTVATPNGLHVAVTTNHNDPANAHTTAAVVHTTTAVQPFNTIKARQVTETETEICIPIFEEESTQVSSGTPTSAGPETFVEIISGSSETVTFTPATQDQPSPFVSTITTSISGTLHMMVTQAPLLGQHKRCGSFDDI